MVSAALLLRIGNRQRVRLIIFSIVFCKQLIDFLMYVSILAGLSLALIYFVILAWYEKDSSQLFLEK